MSSGPFTYSLSAGAAFVLRSLMEHPNLQTAGEIAGAHDEIDAAGAQSGLDELERHGLAGQDGDGRWSLTGA